MTRNPSHWPHLPLRHKQTPVCAVFNHEGPVSACMFSPNTWVAASTLAISTAAILGHTSLLVLWLVRDLKKETPAECSSVRSGRFSLYQENRSWVKDKPLPSLNRESFMQPELILIIADLNGPKKAICSV